jgi:hypothetical protein
MRTSPARCAVTETTTGTHRADSDPQAVRRRHAVQPAGRAELR